MNIKKRCNQINCNELINTSETYCSNHKQESNKRYDKIRSESDSLYVSFYKTKEWRNLRYQVLLDEGFCCRRCGLNANIGDHIIPIKENWDMRLERSNIQAMCKSCHNQKTREDELRYR